MKLNILNCYRYCNTCSTKKAFIEDFLEIVNFLNNYSIFFISDNADLNLRIAEDGLMANPITVEGFAFMWAGARANYGVTKGKVCYEVKVAEELKVNHLPDEETNRHVVRLGYSLDSCSTQLGKP